MKKQKKCESQNTRETAAHFGNLADEKRRPARELPNSKGMAYFNHHGLTTAAGGINISSAQPEPGVKIQIGHTRQKIGSKNFGPTRKSPIH